jgi:hypothetical protein
MPEEQMLALQREFREFDELEFEESVMREVAEYEAEQKMLKEREKQEAEQKGVWH